MFHKQDEDREELHREGEEDLQAYVITNEPGWTSARGS